jgi:hypothetical protein
MPQTKVNHKFEKPTTKFTKPTKKESKTPRNNFSESTVPKGQSIKQTPIPLMSMNSKEIEHNKDIR